MKRILLFIGLVFSLGSLFITIFAPVVVRKNIDWQDIILWIIFVGLSYLFVKKLVYKKKVVEK